jgi:ribosomal protein L40E
MPTSVHKCSACGAPLSVTLQGGRIRCEYCGNVTAIENSRSDSIVCPECGTANPLQANHCSKCGIKFTFNCPKCNALNSYGTRFCTSCGIDIQAEINRIQEEKEQQQEEEERRLQEEHERQEQLEQKKREKQLKKKKTSDLTLYQ